MNWHRLGKLTLVGIATFAAIVLGAFVLIRLMAPTISLARMVAFNAVMFAVTGAVVAVVVWVASNRREPWQWGGPSSPRGAAYCIAWPSGE